jgi:hypothetical protein
MRAPYCDGDQCGSPRPGGTVLHVPPCCTLEEQAELIEDDDATQVYLEDFGRRPPRSGQPMA